MNRRKFIYNSSFASLSVMGINSCNLLDNDVKLTILHTNDVHSQIEPFPLNHNEYPN
ncbi:MAG: bifunctional metallophosphatase/5'-nucleotidase, partial [Cryomorphaceae bacterium]|nr:bifunctional metallophosphatase/5'-nucleotidase [Cryomorphaceae bacterium]